jgi:hypothetical protein
MVPKQTKGNQLPGSQFGIPCIGVTEGTHLRPTVVVLMMVDRTKGGWLFLRWHLSLSKLDEFEHDFFTLLERIQFSTNLIDKDLDIWDAFRILRSLIIFEFVCHITVLLKIFLDLVQLIFMT